MPEELGKIEKPPVDEFRVGRKLFFVPLVLPNPDLPLEFSNLYSRYWDQVDAQISNLETKLGIVNCIFHELVPEAGEEGIKTLKQLKVNSLSILQKRIGQGTVLEAVEDKDILAELMDLSRCLSLGLQSQKVFSNIYGFYTEANKNRNDFIARKINDTLKDNESGILIMGEGHHVQFSPDIRIFYVAPPALDEIKRWTRDYENKMKEVPSDQDSPTNKAPDR